MQENDFVETWIITLVTYIPFGDLNLSLDDSSHCKGGIDATLDGKLRSDGNNARDPERSTGEWQIKNDTLLLIGDLRNSLESDYASNFSLIVQREIALA